MIVVLLGSVALATAAVVGKNNGSAPAPALLTGTVVLSPATPLCRMGQSCSRPLAGFKLVFSQKRAVVARTKTDRNGRYRVSLRPGTYAVRTPADGRARIGRGLEPTRIRVGSVRRATVDFTYDAGIR
jgi:hypothetical protein